MPDKKNNPFNKTSDKQPHSPAPKITPQRSDLIFVSPYTTPTVTPHAWSQSSSDSMSSIGIMEYEENPTLVSSLSPLSSKPVSWGMELSDDEKEAIQKLLDAIPTTTNSKEYKLFNLFDGYMRSTLGKTPNSCALSAYKQLIDALKQLIHLDLNGQIYDDHELRTALNEMAKSVELLVKNNNFNEALYNIMGTLDTFGNRFKEGITALASVFRYDTTDTTEHHEEKIDSRVVQSDNVPSQSLSDIKALRNLLGEVLRNKENADISQSQIKMLEKFLTPEKFLFLKERYGLTEEPLNRDGLRKLIIGVLMNAYFLKEDGWLFNNFTKSLFSLYGLENKYNELVIMKTKPSALQLKSAEYLHELMVKVGNNQNQIWNEFEKSSVGTLEQGLNWVKGKILSRELKSHFIERFLSNYNFKKDLNTFLTITGIDEWRKVEQPAESISTTASPFAQTDAKKEKEKVKCAANEYLFQQLAYTNLQEGMVVPVIELDGSQNFYQVKNLINEFGVAGFVLVPVDPNQSLDIKVVFKDSGSLSGEILDTENYTQIQEFMKYKRLLLKNLDRIVSEFKNKVGSLNAGKVSMNIGGRGGGGVVAQLLTTELVAGQATRRLRSNLYDSQTIKELRENIDKQVEYEREQREDANIPHPAEFSDPCRLAIYKDRMKRKILMRLIKTANFFDDIKITSLTGVDKLTLTTINSGGVPAEVKDTFIQSLYFIQKRDPSNSFKIEHNATMVQEDLVHKTGDVNLATYIPEALMPVCLIKIKLGFDLLVSTLDAAALIMKIPFKAAISHFSDSAVLELIPGMHNDAKEDVLELKKNITDVLENIKNAYFTNFFRNSQDTLELTVCTNTATSANQSLLNTALIDKLPKSVALFKRTIHDRVKKLFTFKTFIKELALHKAVKKSDKNLIAKLLKKGQDVSAVDNNGFTSLHIAAQQGNVDVVELLLREGINVAINIKDNRGLTPLHWAIQNGHSEVVKILLQNMHLKEMKNIADHNGMTPLHMAVYNSHNNESSVEIVKMLLQHLDPQSINLQDIDGLTALHWAVLNGNRKIITILSDNGANADIEDNHGVSPRILAFMLHDKNIHSGLMDLFEDLPIANNPAHTSADNEAVKLSSEVTFFTSAPSRVSGEYEHSVQRLYSLLEQGDHDVTSTTLEGILSTLTREELQEYEKKHPDKNILHLAAKKGFSMIIARLIEAKLSNTNDKDGNGNTALYVAIAEKQVDSVVQLLSQGASWDGSEKYIKAAFQSKDNIIITSLIESPPTPMHKPIINDVLFLEAIANGLSDIVQDLLLGGTLNDNVINQIFDSNASKTLMTGVVKAIENEHSDIAIALLAYLNTTEKTFGTAITNIFNKKPLGTMEITNNELARLLHIAAEAGNLKVIEKLLEKGVDINAKDEDGKTALHIAAERGHLNAVKLLINNHAEVDIKDHDNKIPLELAVISTPSNPSDKGYSKATKQYKQVVAEFLAIPKVKKMIQKKQIILTTSNKEIKVLATEKPNSEELMMNLHDRFLARLEQIGRNSQDANKASTSTKNPLVPPSISKTRKKTR